MQFFEKLSQLLTEDPLSFSIMKKNDIISVSVIPTVTKEVSAKISPIVMSGTAEELDEGFISILEESKANTAGFVSNIKAHEKSVKEIDEQNEKEKADKEKKKEEKASTSGKKTDSKAKKRTPEQEMDFSIKAGNAALKQKSFDDAIECYTKALTFAKTTADKTKVNDLIMNAKVKKKADVKFAEEKPKSNFEAALDGEKTDTDDSILTDKLFEEEHEESDNATDESVDDEKLEEDTPW